MQPDGDRTGSVSPDFFGRRAELQTLAAALQDAKAGRAGMVLLAGEPGIGKTRLAEEAAKTAVHDGFLTVWGRWREGSRQPELWAWGQVLRGLLRANPPATLRPGMESALSELSALLPELRDGLPGLAPPLRDVGESRRLRLLDAVLRLLRRCAADRPLLLLFDNLHLAPEASMDLLAAALPELADCTLLAVGIYRDLPVHRRDPLASFLCEVRPMRTVRELTLGPLSPEEAAALAGHLMDGTASAALLQQIVERTQGHPLFVRETALLVQRESRRQREHGRRFWEVEIPRELGLAIQLRVGRMSPAGADALRRCAVVGRSFTLGELRLAGAGAEDGRAQELLEEGIEHGFLSRGEAAGEFHFDHPLIHEAVRGQVPPPERRRLCETLVEAVERTHSADLGVWALRLSAWWSEVQGEKARARVRRYLRLSAEAAQASGSWEEAIQLYERIEGLGEEGVDPEETAMVQQGLGIALYRVGRHEQGIGLLQKAFHIFKDLGRLEDMVRIATEPVYLLVGQPGFHDFFEEILPLLPPGSAVEAQVLHFYGVAQILSVGDYPRAADLFSRALRIGEKAADTVTQARNLAALGFVDNASGRHEDCVTKASRALELISAAADPYAAGHASYVLSSALLALGRGGEAIQHEDRLLETARLIRDGVQIASACQLRARQEVMAGRWQEAVELCDQGLAACPDHLFLLAFRAFLEYTRGEMEAGDRFRARILGIQKQTPSGPWRAHIQAASTAAVRARNSGDTAELGRYVPLLRSIAAHPRAHPFIRQRAHLLLAFTAAMSGDDRLALGQYSEIRKLPALQLVRSYLKDRFLGLAAHCFGDHAGAASHLESARGLARRYGDRPVEAWILCELGEALSPAGSDPAAVVPARRRLLEARELAASLGMPPLQRRAEEALLRLSEVEGSGSPAHAHLSERERQVLRLVAAGCTNGAAAAELGISANTVANHLRSILGKLGAANRTEAAARARKLGLL